MDNQLGEVIPDEIGREEAKKRIRELYTYYPPKTDEQRENHEKVNQATIEYHEKLIDILPAYCEQTAIISNLLGIVRNKANEALALYVNRQTQTDE